MYLETDNIYVTILSSRTPLYMNLNKYENLFRSTVSIKFKGGLNANFNAMLQQQEFIEQVL